MTRQEKERVEQIAANRWSFDFWKWPELIRALFIALAVEQQEQAALRDRYREAIDKTKATQDIVESLGAGAIATREELSATKALYDLCKSQLDAVSSELEGARSSIKDMETQLLNLTLESEKLKLELIKTDSIRDLVVRALRLS